MTRSADSRLRRAVRRFTLGSGPLKRGSDRVQMVARVVVVLAFLAAPVLAVAVANATTTHLEAVAAAQAAERQHTRATLLEDAPATPRADTGDYPAAAVVPVRAGWAARDGSQHEGVVLVRPGARAGTAVPVWVDQYGRLTRPPLDPVAIPGSAVAVAALPFLGVPLAAWTLYAALTAALDAHRQRRWASDWAAVAPRWGTRL